MKRSPKAEHPFYVDCGSDNAMEGESVKARQLNGTPDKEYCHSQTNINAGTICCRAEMLVAMGTGCEHAEASRWKGARGGGVTAGGQLNGDSLH